MSVLRQSGGEAAPWRVQPAELLHQASWRRSVWWALSGGVGGHNCRRARRFAVFVVSVTFLNIFADIAGSVDAWRWSQEMSVVAVLEAFTFAVFLCEYCLRLWSCVEAEHLRDHRDRPATARWRFALEPLSVIDLLVLCALLADLRSEEVHGFQALRCLRSLRLLAMFKVDRHMPSCRCVLDVIAGKTAELYTAMSLAVALLVLASTAMFYVEHDAQPEAFPSIPGTMWWAVTAMTTVGYGDIVPITCIGKVLASVVSFVGLGIFALPSGIISQGFVQILERRLEAEDDELVGMYSESCQMERMVKREVEQLRASLADLRHLACDMQVDIFAMRRQRADVLVAALDKSWRSR